jgi:hypothetical protein
MHELEELSKAALGDTLGVTDVTIFGGAEEEEEEVVLGFGDDGSGDDEEEEEEEESDEEEEEEDHFAEGETRQVCVSRQCKIRKLGMVYVPPPAATAPTTRPDGPPARQS